MNNLINYLFQVIVVSAILYGYYHFALRNNKFHQYNRIYLLSSVVFSLLLPLLEIPMYITSGERESSYLIQTISTLNSIQSSPVVSLIPMASSLASIDYSLILYYGYCCLILILFLKMLRGLLRINKLIRDNSVEKIGSVYFINTDEASAPFSFFKWMFWNRDIPLRTEKGEHMFRHELFHIQQKHSLDIICMELLTIFFWINPFFHLAKKELKAIHEFLADRFAISEKSKWDYAELLLMRAFNTSQSLVHPFFNTQIKRRIAMITSSKQSRYQYLRRILVLPLLTLVVALFAFSYKSINRQKVDTDIITTDNQQQPEVQLPIDTPRTKVQPEKKMDSKLKEVEVVGYPIEEKTTESIKQEKIQLKEVRIEKKRLEEKKISKEIETIVEFKEVEVVGYPYKIKVDTMIIKEKKLSERSPNKTVATGEITIHDLKIATAKNLVQLADNAKIVRFSFIIKLPEGKLSLAENEGEFLKPLIKSMVSQAKVGATVTLDNILIKTGEVEIKLPSRIYKVVGQYSN